MPVWKRDCRECSKPIVTTNHMNFFCSDKCRFMNKVIPEPNSGCWLWLGGTGIWGHGCFHMPSGQMPAHRFAYENFVGPIPEGLHIDHLCRVPGCVNPAHLEAVTSRENTLRGVGPPAIQARKTHCISGHEFSGENLHLTPNGRHRVCKICKLRDAIVRGHSGGTQRRNLIAPVIRNVAEKEAAAIRTAKDKRP